VTHRGEWDQPLGALRRERWKRLGVGYREERLRLLLDQQNEKLGPAIVILFYY
jgi:hypothetical protein